MNTCPECGMKSGHLDLCSSSGSGGGASNDYKINSLFDAAVERSVISFKSLMASSPASWNLTEDQKEEVYTFTSTSARIGASAMFSILSEQGLIDREACTKFYLGV